MCGSIKCEFVLFIALASCLCRLSRSLIVLVPGKLRISPPRATNFALHLLVDRRTQSRLIGRINDFDCRVGAPEVAPVLLQYDESLGATRSRLMTPLLSRQ